MTARRPLLALGADDIALRCNDAVIGVRCEDPDIRRRIGRRLALGALMPGARRSRARRAHALYTWSSPVGSRARRHSVVLRCSLHERTREIADTRQLEYAMDVLVHDAEFRVAIHSPDRLFVHAATVGWEDMAIVLPGHSHAGKSTLTAALVRAGAAYYSDEYTVLDAHGFVQPFPRRLHLRSPDGGASRDVTADELGGRVGTEPLRVGLVVAATYRSDAQWAPAAMSPAQSALAIAEHTIIVRSRPTHALARLARAIGHDVVGLRGERGDADDTAQRVLAHASTLRDARASPVPRQSSAG